MHWALYDNIVILWEKSCARVFRMTFALYDYLDIKGSNDFKKWTLSLGKQARAKLNAKLDMLARHGPGLWPHVLTGTPTPGIQKLRVKGTVQYRPMLCDGPIQMGSEYTLLLGAKEVQSKFVPVDADQIADGRKLEIISDITRRVKHERVS